MHLSCLNWSGVGSPVGLKLINMCLFMDQCDSMTASSHSVLIFIIFKMTLNKNVLLLHLFLHYKKVFTSISALILVVLVKSHQSNPAGRSSSRLGWRRSQPGESSIPASRSLFLWYLIFRVFDI